MTRHSLPLAALLLVFAACSGGNAFKGMSDQQLYNLAKQEYRKGDYGHAIRVLNYLTLNYGNSKYLDDAQMLLAQSDFGDKQYVTAHADFQAFVQRYPADPRAAQAALGMCRSLAAMSPIPERDQTYTNAALTACNNVIADYPSTNQSDSADVVAQKMRDKLAHREYLDAEFYLRRHLTDSAIRYFGFVVSDYPHSPWAPRALLGVYRANLEIGYDDLAKRAKEHLINSYPNSKEAKSLQSNGSNG